MEYENIFRAAQGLAELLGLDDIRTLEYGTMGNNERGWSGAEVRRIKVTYKNGESGTMILKKAEFKERMAMETLTEHGHANTPATFSEGLAAGAPEWMAMQDLGSKQDLVCADDKWMYRVAKALARIHTAYMGQREKMPWLPHADAAYWQRVTTKISIDHFERMVEERKSFGEEFGKYLPLLRRKAEIFSENMAALYRENESLTLTHGDLQTTDGAHIYNCSGTPFIIDFGWCRYAPFYVDLASYFSREEAGYYYRALASEGITLSFRDFDERLRAASPYYGFIYLYPSLMEWAEGPTERTGKRLLQMLKVILTGEFPEHRMNYSNRVFGKLLVEHQQGKLGK